MNSSRSSNEPASDNRTTRRQCSNHVSNATSSKSLGDRRALSLDRTNCEKCNQTNYTPEFLSDVKRFHILGFLFFVYCLGRKNHRTLTFKHNAQTVTTFTNKVTVCAFRDELELFAISIQ